MGAVFRAENVLTGKQVALKWMHAHLAQHPEASRRFLREARTASSLMHPNVVDVYDVVQDESTLCLVMELLEGETLRDFLQHTPQPQVHVLLALLCPAMAGVAAAHERGIVHRDLKPDNIFLARVHGEADPVPKVVDFGIAKFSTDELSTLTQTGTAIGTPMYMSLEQLRGDKDVDGRTDVFAFGVMLYQGLTGRTPFGGASLSELAIRIATTDPLTVYTLRPDLPPELGKVVDRAVARDREQRWQTLPSLMQALAPFRTPDGRNSRMNVSRSTLRLDSVEAQPPRKQPTPLDTLAARELADARSGIQRAWPIWAAATLLFLVACIGAIMLIRNAGADVAAHPGSETTTHAVTATPPPPVAPAAPTPTASADEEIVPTPNTEPLPNQDLRRPEPPQPMAAPVEPVRPLRPASRPPARPRPPREAKAPEPKPAAEKSPADVLAF